MSVGIPVGPDLNNSPLADTTCPAFMVQDELDAPLNSVLLLVCTRMLTGHGLPSLDWRMNWLLPILATVPFSAPCFNVRTAAIGVVLEVRNCTSVVCPPIKSVADRNWQPLQFETAADKSSTAI
jgi:hypothetical protein